MDLKTAWAQEWTTLQNNFERYEHGVLWLKLASVLVFLTGAMLLIEPLLLAVLLLVLWCRRRSTRPSRTAWARVCSSWSPGLQRHPVPTRVNRSSCTVAGWRSARG